MKIIMLKGLPGCSKSKWAVERAKTGAYTIISRKNIYTLLGREVSDKDYSQVRNNLIRMSLKLKRSVIIDDYNLNPKYERFYSQMAKQLGVGFEINSFTDESVYDCIEKDRVAGVDSVGEKQIWNMYYKFVVPTPVEYLQENFDKPRCILLEIDGVLTQDIDGKEDSMMACIMDSLFEYGIENNSDKYPYLVVITNRSADEKEKTMAWLDNLGLKFDEIFFNQDGEPEVEYKKKTLEDDILPFYGVLGVFENNYEVSRMYKDHGIRTLRSDFADLL